MTINSRNKGASAEREVSRLIYDELGIKLSRNLEQWRSGGHDLTAANDGPLSSYAIEVKRYAKISNALLKNFWQQAANQADRAGKTPLLLFRADREDWQAVIPLYKVNAELSQSNQFDNVAVLSLPAFCGLVREQGF